MDDLRLLFPKGIGNQSGGVEPDLDRPQQAAARPPPCHFDECLFFRIWSVYGGRHQATALHDRAAHGAADGREIGLMHNCRVGFAQRRIEPGEVCGTLCVQILTGDILYRAKAAKYLAALVTLARNNQPDPATLLILLMFDLLDFITSLGGILAGTIVFDCPCA